MPAQGWSVAIPWDRSSREPANAESVSQDLEPHFAKAFSVRARFFSCYPGYKPWARIRELLRSSTSTAYGSSSPIHTQFESHIRSSSSDTCGSSSSDTYGVQAPTNAGVKAPTHTGVQAPTHTGVRAPTHAFASL